MQRYVAAGFEQCLPHSLKPRLSLRLVGAEFQSAGDFGKTLRGMVVVSYASAI